MAENETVTGSQSDGSAVGWAGKYLQSDLLAPSPAPAGEPATRSLHGSASTGLRTTDLSVAPVRFGHYELLERIGQGGMGTVYRVRNLELDRHEAMKLIARNADDSGARTRFEREFLSLAKIEHQHIVPVYAAGTWDGVPYFTMKFVPGGALAKHLDRFRADPAAAAGLMAKVARAVGKLHAAGVLHRDLKPHNILLGDGDEPLVADFGLVKKLGEDSDASVTGAPMGTRQYMSPEQTFAQKADYTPACDIWAIGVILYELLAGERPFPSTDPVEVYIQIRGANPKPLLEVNPAAPRELAAVAHRCLAKVPAERYQTAAAVADDLEAWLAGDAVTATLAPPPRPVRSRWVGWVAGVAAGVAVVAVAVAAARPSNQAVTEATARVPVGGIPTGPIPTAAERFARGEVVEFVGESGGIRYPFAYLQGGVENGVGLDKEGRLALASPGYLGVELLSSPIPPPGTRFEAEMSFTNWSDVRTRAGVFVGGADLLGPNGPRHSLVQLVRKYIPQRGEGDQPKTTKVRTGLEFWQWQHRLSPESVFDRKVWEQTVVTPERPEATPWHRLVVTLAPDRVEATWDGFAITPFTTADAWIQLQERVAVPFGPRLGLMVFNGGASFRNVRLVPPGSP